VFYRAAVTRRLPVSGEYLSDRNLPEWISEGRGEMDPLWIEIHLIRGDRATATSD